MTATIHETYQRCREALPDLDRSRCAAVLGLHSEGGDLMIPFCNEVCRLSNGAFTRSDGRPPTDAVGLVLCRYLLNCPDEPPAEGRQLTFREIDGAGPLVSSFATNTNKVITSAFAQDAAALETAGGRMGGVKRQDVAGYDLVMEFAALPRIPIVLQFNAADDPFPAQCSLLFHASAQVCLDMQTLFILGTYLAGGLVGHASDETG